MNEKQKKMLLLSGVEEAELEKKPTLEEQISDLTDLVSILCEVISND